ncbi:putative fatty acyl-CoA reductase 2-like [Capsicum annuum]|nr:putative fatty acyl-CoA reductase 2-like [Capsicum annuum]
MTSLIAQKNAEIITLKVATLKGQEDKNGSNEDLKAGNNMLRAKFKHLEAKVEDLTQQLLNNHAVENERITLLLHQFSNSPSALGDHQGDVLANNGIGIVEFFEAKNILVTSATGFLANVLIEKMLRTTPKINKIYILIRAKDKEAAFDRVTSEIIESKVFKCLKEMLGESYESFIRSKLVPIVGNIHEPNLGMDSIIAHQVAQEIDLIVDSAANITFDLRYDLALEANVNGPYQLMLFAKKCKKLKILVHYSTAYVNGEREGLIYEKPFTMGESITKERVTSHSPSTKFPSLNVANELDFVSKLKNAIENNDTFDKIMKDLGPERFHNGNMRKLMENMSEEERENFDIDVSKINWRDYFVGVQILGVKENALNGKSTIHLFLRGHLFEDKLYRNKLC